MYIMIGRTAEIETMNRLFDSPESEFLAVYGRRRVGKTYLIRETFEGKFSFVHTGLPNVSTKKQIAHFYQSLKNQGLSQRKRPNNWFAAFDLLKSLVESKPEPRKIIFIDELPWMDAQQTDFLSAIESFWNEWACARKDIFFIVCGSASSWMVKKLFRNKGALHNRVTARIRLMPFSLAECELYARDRGLQLTRKDIADCYMALGGIPYYWRNLTRGVSLPQNFDNMFFSESGPLRKEFGELYSSLFKNATSYVKVVTALAKKKIGMSRREISEATGIKESGRLSDILDTLVESGFLHTYRTFGKKKRDCIYQLIDNFTLFHFRFLDGTTSDPHFWTSTINSPMQNTWRGLAFERLCLQHIEQMRSALGIAGVHTETYAWRHTGDDIHPKGTQIDLLLDRSDNVINICEMKYSRGTYSIDATTSEQLSEKAEIFRAVSNTNKAIHITMVTTNGVTNNMYKNTIQSEITLDDLFK